MHRYTYTITPAKTWFNEYQKLFCVVSYLYLYHAYHVREKNTSGTKPHTFSPKYESFPLTPTFHWAHVNTRLFWLLVHMCSVWGVAARGTLSYFGEKYCPGTGVYSTIRVVYFTIRACIVGFFHHTQSHTPKHTGEYVATTNGPGWMRWVDGMIFHTTINWTAVNKLLSCCGNI